MGRIHRRLGRIALLVGSLTAAALANSQEASFGVSAGFGTTDNVLLTPDGGESETIATLGVQIDVDHDGSKLDATATGNVSLERYLDDTYDDDVVGRLDALLRFSFVPERFSWVAQENYGQMQVDPVSALTPDNRESVNYFSTGPDFNFRFGSDMFATLGARYSISDFEVSPIDGDRLVLMAGFGRSLADTSRLTLNVTSERLEFDNPINEDYDRIAAFLTYDLKGARTDLKVDVGQSEVRQDSGDFDGPIARIAVTRQLSSSASLALEGGVALTDASDSFRQLGTVQSDNIVVGPSNASPETFERQDAQLTWRYARNRTTLYAIAQWADDDYEQSQQLDVTRHGMQLGLERAMSRFLTGRVFGSRTESEYQSPAFTDEMWSAGFQLSWLIGRTLALELRFDHTNRDADGEDFDYEENRAFLTLNWRSRRR
jgi:hypothetical protein